LPAGRQQNFYTCQCALAVKNNCCILQQLDCSVLIKLKIAVMSFQAYMDNIKTKTGKSAEDFKKLATQKGLLEKGQLKEGVKAAAIVSWLKEDFGLGHGHAMALFAFFKGKTA
jgi:Domain of unknown function (DUF4287)